MKLDKEALKFVLYMWLFISAVFGLITVVSWILTVPCIGEFVHAHEVGLGFLMLSIAISAYLYMIATDPPIEFK